MTATASPTYVRKATYTHVSLFLFLYTSPVKIEISKRLPLLRFQVGPKTKTQLVLQAVCFLLLCYKLK